MAVKSILLRCLAKSAVKHAANLLTFGVGGDLLTDIWEAWRQAQDEDKRKKEIERLATVSPTDVHAAAAEIIQEEGASLPAEQQRQLVAWLTQTPGTIRRSLKRPSDLLGRTVAPGQAPTCARDLAALIPPRPPRFKPGDRPIPGVDLVVEELLGVGGFGEVWKARNPHLASAAPVALKFCLDGHARQLLRHESAVLDEVMREGKHPGIVELRHTYLSANPPCLEYQYVEGGDLTDLIRDWHQKGQATPERMAQVILRLAGIVAFAHERGIVHRDLKPANLLTEKKADGKVRLRVTDFGIGAVEARHAADQVRRETQGTADLATVARGFYTPLYASPQQIRGDKADPRDDVFALGVIWYQALTGELSEGAPTGEGWKESLRSKGMSEDLLALLVSCVEGGAEHRPANGRVVEQRLRAALEPGFEPAPTPTPSPSESEEPNRGGQAMLVMAGVFLFVAAAGMVVWFAGLEQTSDLNAKHGGSSRTGGKNGGGRLTPPSVDTLIPPATERIAGLPNNAANKGEWSIEGDDLVQTDTGVDTGIHFGSIQWDDYTYEAELQLMEGEGHITIGYRVGSNGSAYLFILQAQAGVQNQRIQHWNNDTKRVDWELAASNNRGIADNKWHQIKVEVYDKSHRVYLDQQLMLSGDNPHLLQLFQGKVGFRTVRCSARFRNILLTDKRGKVLWKGLPTLPD